MPPALKEALEKKKKEKEAKAEEEEAEEAEAELEEVLKKSSPLKLLSQRKFLC